MPCHEPVRIKMNVGRPPKSMRIVLIDLVSLPSCCSSSHSPPPGYTKSLGFAELDERHFLFPQTTLGWDGRSIPVCKVRLHHRFTGRTHASCEHTLIMYSCTDPHGSPSWLINHTSKTSPSACSSLVFFFSFSVPSSFWD